MSTLSKSPLRVALWARAVSRPVLPAYAHEYGPKKFTQPQRFACLVLKTFYRTDYRGPAAHPADNAGLRAALGLACVPHFATPQKAARRLFREAVRRFLGRRRRVRRAAPHSTGLDCGRAGRFCVRRRRRAVRR